MADLDWICWYPWRAAGKLGVFLLQSSVLIAAQQMPAWAVEHETRITVLETWNSVAHWGVPLILLVLVAVLVAIVRATGKNGRSVERMDSHVQHIREVFDRVTEVKLRDTTSGS